MDPTKLYLVLYPILKANFQIKYLGLNGFDFLAARYLRGFEGGYIKDIQTFTKRRG